MIAKLSAHEISMEEMLMIREVLSVFRIMVDSQPLLMTERSIKSLPAELYGCLSTDRMDDNTWSAIAEAAMLGMEILLKMGSELETCDVKQFKELLQKWVFKMKHLLRMEPQGNMRDELEFLAAELAHLSI
jgi:hypothetical protein